MIKIKNLTLGDGIPKICVPVMGENREKILAMARLAAASGADLAEWRADFYEDIKDTKQAGETLSALSAILGEIPILFTLRSLDEGGILAVTGEDYVSINLWAATHPEVQMIDVEILNQKSGEYSVPDLIKNIQKAGKYVVGSTHFFHETPGRDKMLEILKHQEALGADILKLAVMPASGEDVLRLMEITLRASETTNRPVITMSMGSLGCVTRACGRLTGSALTFGAVGETSAPGQMPVKDLKRMLELF